MNREWKACKRAGSLQLRRSNSDLLGKEKRLTDLRRPRNSDSRPTPTETQLLEIEPSHITSQRHGAASTVRRPGMWGIASRNLTLVAWRLAMYKRLLLPVGAPSPIGSYSASPVVVGVVGVVGIIRRRLYD